MTHDHIIVGSGCTGVMAAQTLVEAGLKVTMLDVGMEDQKYKRQIPDKDFISLRKEDKTQYSYLIGEDFESIPWGNISTGAQLTPPRKFMTELVDRFLPVVSDNFFPMESLAYGGLGNGWGVGCCEFSDLELEKCGLNIPAMRQAYKIVAERIGICGAKDDAGPYTLGDLDYWMPPLEINNNCEQIYERYCIKRTELNTSGFFMEKPALAVLTEDRPGRKKYQYDEMDFYSDKHKSAYRPWITADELKKKNNFLYIDKILVTDFTDENEMVKANGINTANGERVSFHCKKLILSPGVLGTARIVLRSFALGNKTLPLICNPYTYMPCLNFARLGKEIKGREVGFAQLALFHDEQKNNFDVAMASFYSYRSLLLFRIMKEMPLNFVDAGILIKYLLPGLTILGIHHPQEASENKFLSVIKDDSSPTGDKLKIEYSLSEKEADRVDWREKKFMKAIRLLGLRAIKRVNPGIGSSIHYGGTLPFNGEGREFSVSFSGRLNGTKNVFVADGSGFRYLPAKGLTFSLMANAHNVANSVTNE